MPEESPLLNFVALDLETTGLDPRKDRIIEIGAVRLRDGQVDDRFSQLVDPQRPLPNFISRLTGITDADLQGQQVIGDVLPEIMDFIGSDPLVAHNASFDVSFLSAALMREGGSDLKNPFIDTLLLSCVLLPRLRDHRLATLVEYYDVDLENAHRALDDAQATAQVYLYLLQELVGCDPSVLALLSRLAVGAASGLEAVFVQGLKESVRGVLGRKISAAGGRPELMQQFFNFSGELSDEPPQRGFGEEYQQLELSSLESLFGPKTSLGRTLGQYEQRPQQVNMAQAVARAFNWGEFLAVEAGTGTGKSLAYLIPAILWAVQNGTRVIVSTHTKNLQEQLFYKDIPLLHQALETPFTAALVKGRSNYLCLNKWNWIISQAEQVLTPEQRRQLLPLTLWVHQTETGDLVENTGFHPDAELWGKVCAERNYCLGPRCRYHGSCFLMRIRRAAVSAHIVVVNHSLFFSDLATDNAVLSDYDFVIFDEAHRLEEVATQYMGAEFNWWILRAMLNRLQQREKIPVGILPSLKRRVEHMHLSGTAKKSLLDALEGTAEVRGDLWRMATEFFQAVKEAASAVYGQGEGGYTGKHRYRHDSQFLKFIVGPAEQLQGALVRLKGRLADLSGRLDTIQPGSIKDGEKLMEDLLARSRDCQDIIAALDHLVAADEDNCVYWVETPVREDSLDARLLSAPLNVAQLMRNMVYQRLLTAVHTSATLTVAGEFDHFINRIGMSLAEPERQRTIAVGSPFDFEEQALVCLPAYLPTPREPRFLEEAIEALHTALLTSRGGALILFTSYEMLDRTYEVLGERLSQEGILVLGQGRDGSRTNILNRFRQEKEAVLMGTSSFWEGVDIPGDSLRLLVLMKLPFQVPTEPIVEAHVERLEKQGHNAFQEYLLPEAVIRFRQGFGRLIRRADDRGVVLILDRRALSARYGTTFLRSLPTRTYALDSPQALEDDIQRWLWAEKKPPGGGSIPFSGLDQ